MYFNLTSAHKLYLHAYLSPITALDIESLNRSICRMHLQVNFVMSGSGAIKC